MTAHPPTHAAQGPIRLAFDGGQSALRVRVIPDGRTGSGPGYTHSTNSIQATVEAVRVAADRAGVTGSVEVAALGLTGFPKDQQTAEILAKGISATLRAKEVRLTQDMVTAHAGALPNGYGLVVSAGTGVVCLGIDRDGRGPATTLADTDLDPIALYPSPTLVDDVARFAPVVLRRAAEEDPVAHDIVVRAAADLAETIA